MTLNEISTLISREEGKQASCLKSLEEAKKTMDSLSKKQVLLERAQVFLQDTAKRTQEQLKIHIEDLVQLALDTCFPGIYEFKVEFEIKRGKTEATLLFYTNGMAINPMEASGGGVIDLAAFALRIASWTLSKTRNVVILDEPFRFLSKDLQPQANQIIKELSKRLNLQFILVTHSPEMVSAADRIFEVRKEKGKSIVTIRD